MEQFALITFGAIVGAFLHYRHVIRVVTRMEREEANRRERLSADTVDTYIEEDWDHHILRMYQMGTDRFIAQGSDVDDLIRSFNDRFPGKICNVFTDEEQAALLGIEL